MRCDICGRSGARIHRVSRTYGAGKNALLVEGVPMVRCPRCGESYLTAETLHEIERLKMNRSPRAVIRKIRVMSYAR